MNASLIFIPRTEPRRARRQGFSLAELMVVIVILGLLATIVVPNVVGYLFKANIAKAKTDIAAIEQAVTTYAVENGGRYPESIENLVQPDENGKTYLQGYTSVPLDPWKNEYVYSPPDGTRDFLITSYGKDGIPGGEGDDADIDNLSMKNQRR
jgi:general secretion pathway protein G